MKSLIRLFQNNPFILFILTVFVFFYPFFLQGKIPIPADTIVGMYHPFRDVIWDNYTSGVPFKNFLITDPVRQQYVWRNLSIDEFKKGNLPLWNPYSFSGTPLLSNFQGASFYPLNVLFFILPFNLAWGILIILQPLLTGIFLYLYLRFINLSKFGSLLGALVFAFSGFSIAWLEWNTIGHAILWLPLILLAKEKLLKRLSFKWITILIFAEISSILAGHLQVLFYTLIVSNIYLFVRIIQSSSPEGKNKNIVAIATKKYIPFLVIGAIVLTLTAFQWLPTFQFIFYSTRNIDQGSWMKEGWFIPWQNLIQFIAPDFYGNPATGNYWGIWNYGEFIGFVGIIPLIFALYALIFRRDKKTFFLGALVLVSFIFSLPTTLAKLPYQLQIPFISTSQPTRLIFIIDFALSILTALGFDYFIKSKNLKKTLTVLFPLGLIFLILWLFVSYHQIFQNLISYENLLIARRNLVLPTILFVGGSILFIISNIKKQFWDTVSVFCFLFIIILDLFRFGWKFTPFTKTDWIFPKTKLIDIIKKESQPYRLMSLDRRIMPPNFSVYYKLQDVSGYDPLYLRSYGQLVSAWERDKPDITVAPFNRIITPQNYENFITDLLGVKYLLNLFPIKSEKLEFVTSEGTTYLYKNKEVFPRAFLVEEVLEVKNEQEEIEKIFSLGDKLKKIAVTTEAIKLFPQKLSNDEEIMFIDYQSNYVKIKTKVNTKRLLVLTDTYYPSWNVYIDGKRDKLLKVDFALKGVMVSKGEHIVEFKINLI